MNVLGYLRVSTREQADSGAGLAAQRSAISAEADRRGWTVVEWIEDAGSSGKNMKRAGLQRALSLLAARRRDRTADALVVAKMDRVSRSLADSAGLIALSVRQRWGLIALDLAMDTTTPNGKLFAHMVSAMAEWERDLISQRTRDALAERKAAGVRLGNARMTPPDVVARIVTASAAGHSAARIARDLDADSVPTPNGGARWYPSTVARLLAAESRANAA